jgi:hypothetical protein
MRIITALVLAAYVHAVPLQAIYVNGVAGSDSNSGAKGSPLKTIMKAASAAAASSKAGHGAVDVWIAGGEYSGPFNFNAAHSGSPSAPIAYRSNDGEQVLLSGGKSIPPSLLSASDSGIFTVDLTKFGIHNFGELRGENGVQLGTCQIRKLEAFWNDKPMTLARYPNLNLSTGLSKFLRLRQMGSRKQERTSAENTDKGFQPSQIFALVGDKDHGVLGVSAARAKTWAAEPDIWFAGYFGWDWADAFIKPASVREKNATNEEVEVVVTSDTMPNYNFMNNDRAYAVNALSELDQPGEYYVNNKTGLLSLIPPKATNSTAAYQNNLKNVPRSTDTLRVSVLDSCVLCLQGGVTDLSFVGLEVGYSRGDAVLLDERTANVILRNCTIHNVGGVGAHLTGKNITFIDSTISDVGCQGVNITGGDIETLEPVLCVPISVSRCCVCLLASIRFICCDLHGCSIHLFALLQSYPHHPTTPLPPRAATACRILLLLASLASSAPTPPVSPGLAWANGSAAAPFPTALIKQ